MKRRRLRLLWGPALLLLAVVLVIANMPEKEQLPAGAGEGQRMPAFRAVCTDGSTFDLREQEGKTVVIHVPPGLVSQMIGQKRCNLIWLQERFSLQRVKVLEEPGLKEPGFELIDGGQSTAF